MGSKRERNSARKENLNYEVSYDLGHQAKTKEAPEQYASGDNLQISHYLICGCIYISQGSKLNVIMN